MQDTDVIETAREEAAWIARCQEGDLDAFGKLVDRYRQRIYAQAYHFTQNADDANDLCQETFVRAWQSLHRFRGQSSFYTWLYRIATNLGIDWIRSRAKTREIAFDDATDTGASELFIKQDAPDDRLRHKEAGQAIDLAIAQLTPEHREVIVLRELEGLDYKDIARVVGCSMGTVMSRLHYARAKLQKQLKPYLTR